MEEGTSACGADGNHGDLRMISLSDLEAVQTAIMGTLR